MKLLFNIFLTILGFGAIILEFFVPTAGLIGIIGGGCVITGIVFTYMNYGTMAGSIFLICCAIVGPVILILYFKIFPKSFMGKRLILHKSMKKDEGFVSGEMGIEELTGKSGITETKLRPIGRAEIDDKIYNVTTEGEFIEADKKIYVIKIEGNRIIVSSEEQQC